MLIALGGKAEQIFLHLKQHLHSSRQHSRPRPQIQRSFLRFGSTPCRLTLSQCCSLTCCSFRGSLARHAPTARFVRQSVDALRQKALCPCVHKAPADPDPGRNGSDRYPIGEEEDQPGTSEQPAPDGGRSLPREERLAFLRREGDGERGFASTSHTAPFCERGEAGTTWGSRHSQGNIGGQEDRDDITLFRLPACDGRRCLAHTACVQMLFTRITIPSVSPSVHQGSTDLSVRRGLAQVSASALQGVPCACPATSQPMADGLSRETPWQ